MSGEQTENWLLRNLALKSGFGRKQALKTTTTNKQNSQTFLLKGLVSLCVP